jgi:beta-N-acetylhexosaminidase
VPTSLRLTMGVAGACLMGTLTVSFAPPAAASYGVEPSSHPRALIISNSAAATARHPQTVLHQMTLGQKVGQLFMVGAPAVGGDPATLAHITQRHVGNIMLTGRSYDGAPASDSVARAAQARATKVSTNGVGLLVATDQEGGLVQVLQGPGFSRIPSARTQGGWRPSTLEAAAGRWAGQLARAGVNMNLGPVEDIVPGPQAAQSNPPIGEYDREFGFSPRTVARHGWSFARGMSTHAIVPTIKHFPGLGRVHANPDVAAGVTDYLTTRDDVYLNPFAVSIRAGAPAVMVSTAYYHRIDPTHPAAFSRTIINGMLRGDLRFGGVVISDDLGNARQVSPWNYSARAVKFIAAGGDIVLTVNPAPLPAMYAAVLSRAAHHPHFRHKVNAATLRVLTLKERRGLL